MSWLSRSMTNSLRIDSDSERHAPVLNDDVEERERGMKEDLTEFRLSLTRQLRSVSSFLAPVNSELNRSDSPDPSISGGDHDDSSSVYARISTATSDQSEIGVFYPVMNRILGNNPNLNQLGFGIVDEDDDCDDGVDIEGLINEAGGLTDEVLTFAGNIAHHPETWLDFPVEDDEDLEGKVGVKFIHPPSQSLTGRRPFPTFLLSEGVNEDNRSKMSLQEQYCVAIP